VPRRKKIFDSVYQQQQPHTNFRENMDATWDPERLRLVGSVLTRYAEHLAPGHRIRLGMEGDPCAAYRSADDAPGATVLDVTRDGDVVRFRAQRDDTGEVIERSNRDVGADMLWEIHPDYLETFRAHVEASEGDDDAYAGLKTKVESQLSDFASRLATLEDSVRDDYRSSETMSLASKFEEAEAANRAFRETMASTVRALAGDLMRTARGEGIEFAHQYADRYDLAVAERATFRGGKRKEEEEDDADADEHVHSRYQGEKYNFEESSQLSD
jgi:hypothetical protein